MKLSNLAFPYPIIASDQDWRDDYVESSYQTAYEDRSNCDANKFEFEFTHMLSSPDIKKLIESKSACFAVQLRCDQTMINSVFRSFDAVQTVSLPLNHLFGGFSLTPQIIVLDEIENFSPSDLHKEFGEASFDLKAGDILAFDTPKELQCDFEKIALESLVSVKLNEDLNAVEYEIETGEYRIVIYMGSSVHEVWSSLASDPKLTGPHMWMSIYKDLSCHVLSEIVKDPDNREKSWGKAWIRELGALGLTIGEDADFNVINKLSQRLVADKGLQKLHRILSERGSQ